ALQNWGLLYCRASTASLLMASVPAFTALASHLFLREKIGPARVTGILASMGGIAILVWSEGNLSALKTFNPGSILLIGAAVAWAVYTILGRKLSSSHDPAVVTLQSTVWGILFLLPIALLEKQPSYQGLGLQPWAVLLYLGLIASGLPIFLWNYALKTFDASEAGVYLNLVPVVATALAVPLLGERLRFSEVAAGLMIITGVMLAQGKGRGSAGAEPPKTAGGANRHIPVSLNITRGAERDIEACLAIARNLGEYFTHAACRQMAAELAEHPFYIARDGDEVVGFAVMAARNPQVTEICWLAVARERQGRGVGSALLMNIGGTLKRQGTRLLTVKTLAAQAEYPPYERTRHFYEKMGFVHLDTIDPYPGWAPGHPCALYVKVL
ncbi:MAG TPA: GNAT family N-acetyltransferase, partial [Firmicutes bacterium]|nr:GNAT family N-acetyltransferase [Bacillota bacterium]